MDAFRQWMEKSKPQEKKKLADLAPTSLSMLYQLSYGTRSASAELAGKLEVAIGKINRKNSTLPNVTRGDLTPACAKCPYFKECKK